MTHSLDVSRLVEQYQAGHSVAALARALGVDPSAVRRRLVQAGVSVRGSRAATAANLARDPGVRGGMGRPAVYALRADWFDTLTPDSAYTVGIYQADGANQRDRGIVTITLKASDADLLTELSHRFGGSRPLRNDSSGNPCLKIQNRELSDDLARWGVVSPKTHTASTHVDLLDDRDYWRGVIDGDGSLCIGADGRRFLTLVGSRPICNQWLAFARSHGAGLKVNVRPHKSIYSVHLSGWQAEDMTAVLYDGAGLALARKLAVARSWGATRSGGVTAGQGFALVEQREDGLGRCGEEQFEPLPRRLTRPLPRTARHLLIGRDRETA